MTRSTPNTYFQRLSLLVGCALGLSLTISVPLTARAQEAERCKEWVGKVVSAEGLVEARRVRTNNWQPTTVGATFCPGDKLRVESWRAAIVLSNETIIRLDQGTTITFTEIENTETSWLEILEGIVHFISRVPRSLTITTPFVNATVEGTEFVIRVDSQETNVWVLEGTVRVENTLGKLLLEGGDAAVTRAGEGPQRRLDIHPRDAVQWALYYPPLLDVRTNAVTGPNQPILKGALAQYHTGDIRGALDQLNTLPHDQRDPQFFGIRAGLLLSVGQIDKATMDIEEALRGEPNNGTALALQSVISLVNNNKEEALQLSNQSVKSAPQSSVGYIARSYAQQSHFDIEAALTSAQQATTLSPEDSLSWARVAELQLSLGNRGEAREAAQEAVSLNPNLARTQTILGFALLTEAKIADARQTFERAIALDQADPLPRLGLGLTKIQKSELAEGRRDIEIAASLDPNNAIIRSYLGKAYFEEKWDRPLPKYPIEEMELTDLHNNTRKNQRAASQLALAKELDPKDPTPYFYDAIRKQSVNRPVEALQDLQKSIELNDNRAVYRSSLRLDQDEAARSSAIGRIYSNLGFGQRALVEGWSSLSTDPSNHSAHRLLADSYAARSRHDVARVSELLQSQLLQPININNLQPRLAENSIGLLESAGPSGSSYNEFNPLFIRDRLNFLGNLQVGNQDTLGSDAVIAGMLADPISLSLGHSHFESDGFRRNNDLKTDIYNVFIQTALHRKINFQWEFRRRQSEQGDLEQRFSESFFKPTERREIEQNTIRVGGKVSPSSNSDLIVSFLHSKRTDTTFDPNIFRIEGEDKGYQLEGQYIFRHEGFNAILGGGKNNIDSDNLANLNGVFIPVPPPFGSCIPPTFPLPNCILNTPNNFSRKYNYAYLYTNMEWPNNVIWTGGVSYTDSKDLGLDVKNISPKVGLQWNLMERARLRLAYLQAVKRALIVNQSIEPTNVAGFNQFFDDANGTKSERFGAALDTKLSPTLYSGLEYSQRNLKAPEGLVSTGTGQRFDRMEQVIRGYLYWIPYSLVAFSIDPQWEQFKRQADAPSVTSSGARLPKVETLILPATARVFHPSGFFASLSGTFVNQTVHRAPRSPFSKNDDQFFLVDLSAGFRFPQRLGIASLEVRNLFDKKFSYEDLNFVTNGESVYGRFIPNRTILIRITLFLG